MTEKLKKFIFKKLYKDLSHIEIIQYESSLWFIDRKEKYWYFQYDKCGNLWWRWQFFPNFFNLFSLEQIEFEPIISEWVEEVLNHKVITSFRRVAPVCFQVEEVLNHKVITSDTHLGGAFHEVEEVLNCKVNIPEVPRSISNNKVEEVLNCKVDRTISGFIVLEGLLEEVLNSI